MGSNPVSLLWLEVYAYQFCFHPNSVYFSSAVVLTQCSWLSRPYGGSHFRYPMEKLQNNGELSSPPMLLTSQQQTQDFRSLHS